MTEPTNGNSARGAQGYDIAGMVVALCSPTYGPVDPICAKSLRAAVMFAANRGVKWAGDSSPDKMGYGAARNTGVQHVLRTVPDAHGIMWVDSDIEVGIDKIARLLDTANHGGYDFVSGVYHQRTGYHNPVFHGWSDEKQCFQPAQDYPPNTVGMADGCGFGFVYTSMRMLRDISLSEKFEARSGWFPDKRDVGGFGEDLTFCWLAKQAGYQLYVDSGVQVGHLGDACFVYEADFRRKQKEWYEDMKEQEIPTWGIPTSKSS